MATATRTNEEQSMPVVIDDEWQQFGAVSEEAIKIRRKQFGLDVPQVDYFTRQCEFVSLGSLCAVSRGLQYLGLKEHSYPFDWLRSPVEGVIHLLETDFVDFLAYTTTQCVGDRDTMTYSGTRWGGSFWHHDPRDLRISADFTRRIRRLLGLDDVDVSKPRCFVRAVNNTLELHATLRLRDTLRRSLPSTPFYLVVLVDNQSSSGLLELSGSKDLLFCFICEDQYGDGTQAAAERMLQIFGENYAAGISWALRRWAGDTTVVPKSVANLSELLDLCEQFDGGSCAASLFRPLRFKGQRLCVKENVPDSLPNLIEAATTLFVVPEGASSGAELAINVFNGKEMGSYIIRVPEDCWPGATLQLELREGKLFTSVLAQS